MVFWGIGYATQDTLFKAVVAGVLPEGERNLAFGLFYAGYGVGWLIGSIAMGLLYEQSRVALVVFAVLAQLISLPLFVIAKRQEPSPR
jgi:MFS family permease